MRKCPICMHSPFEKGECKKCGYSISCDYEAYPTFARLKNGTPSKAGRKRALKEHRNAEEQRATEARRKAEASEAAAKKQREEQKRAAEEQRRADEKRRAEAAERKRQEERNRKPWEISAMTVRLSLKCRMRQLILMRWLLLERRLPLVRWFLLMHRLALSSRRSL